MNLKNYALRLLIAVLMSLPSLGIAQTYEVTTLAGGSFLDGPALEAKFNYPYRTAVDGSGNVYVADLGNHRIRKISPAGVVITLAGSGTSGYADGTGTAASFSYPTGINVDGSGNVYVADCENHRIRKISPTGVVTTLAGSGESGYADGTGTAASFYYPTGVAVDGTGNVYVADQSNNRIRKISPTGVVTTLAGSGTTGSANGTGTAASFNFPIGVAVDGSGNVYVADQDNHRIRKISPAGVVTTLAGSGTQDYADGTGTVASFRDPASVAVDGSGNVYVADLSNNRIRKISPTGVVTTLAGSTRGYADGTGTAASFASPVGVAADGAGNIYVADTYNHRIRKISPAGVVITLAGLGTYADGTGTAASFWSPKGVAVDGSGNVYVADELNHRIRKLSPAGVVTTFAGSGTQDYADGTGTAASFNYPSGVAVDGSGNVFVADQDNHRIRKISPAGVVTTLAGSGTQGYTDGTGTAASFYFPSGVAVDGSGNVYVADRDNHRIRKISPTGVVTTLAGSGTQDYTDGTGTGASFARPVGVAADGAGNVYVADQENHRIRKISPAGVVTTLAGSGIEGYVDGIGTAARFFNPTGIAADGAGNIYVADERNHRIRKISPAGVVTTLAGSGNRGFADGTGTTASFTTPFGVAVDGSGNLYVADRYNNAIRKITVSVATSTQTKSSTLAKLEMFPNPATDKVTVNTNGTGTLEILNTVGQVVFTQPATETNEIDVSKLNHGVYIVRFNGASQKLVVR